MTFPPGNTRPTSALPLPKVHRPRPGLGPRGAIGPLWTSCRSGTIATQGAPFNGEDLATRTAGIAERVQRYNEILRDEALAYSTNANGRNPSGIEVVSDYVNETIASAGTTPFGADDINGGDCFHPSVGGQNVLSQVSWDGNPRK